MKKEDIDYSVYLVTDHRNTNDEEFLNIIEEAIKGGTTIVQLREKTASTKEFYQLALKVKEILTNGDMLAEKKGESHFFVSDTTQTFMQTSEILLGKSLDFDVQKIDIEKY